ncbi:MAG: trypsin-like peptidase domain-containing protein [Proteobacteria bacterium]|nr:trypsin-like peptidase domain-containing protein [Pseudomonadota bacterium]
MRLKPFIAALAGLLFLSHAAAAKVNDDRVTLPREKGTPMGTVGMVLHLGAAGSALGTGFLVSPCHVLTAAHVVSEPEGISADQVLLFFIGSGDLGPEYYEANSFAELSPARPVVWGESRDLHKGSTADRREAWQKAGWDDWALLKLDKCLGDEGYGYLKLQPMATTDFTRQGNTLPITSIGLPADHDNEKLTIDPACTLFGQIDSTGWQHDCTSMPGNSGGPILAARPDAGEKWPRVMGITVISTSEHPEELKPMINDPAAPDYLGNLPTAVPVSAFINKIAPYLPKDPLVSTYLAKHSDADRGYNIDDPKKPIADLTAAIAKKPRSALLLTMRGSWLEVAKDESAALIDYSAALRADANFAPALYARAQLRGYRDDKMQGDAKAALADLDVLIKRFPDDPSLRITRGALLSGSYDYRAALIDYDAALKLDPDNISARLTRANARVELGDMKGAKADFDAAVAARDDNAYLLVERANYQLRAGDHAAAFKDIEAALKIEPDMPTAINARAIVHLDLGEVDKALSDANLTVSLDRDPSSGHIALRGTIHHIKGDLKAAIADYRQAEKLNPTEPFDALMLYIALGQADRMAEAKEELRQLLRRWPTTEWPSPLALRLLGENSDADLKKAAEAGTEVLRKYQDFDWHFYLGAQAMLLGDEAKAKAYFQHVVDTDMRQFLEYNLARIFLEKLGGSAYVKG